MKTRSIRQEIRRTRQHIDRALHRRNRVRANREPPTRWRRVEPQPGRPSRAAICDVMQHGPLTVRAETRLDDALQRMLERGLSALPVVDAAGRIAGILTDRDALKIFFEPGATRVDDVMSDAPVTVSVHAPLVDVLDRMMATDLDQVLVYEEAGGARAHGKLVGVVTRARLLPPLLASLRDDVRRRQAPSDGAP